MSAMRYFSVKRNGSNTRHTHTREGKLCPPDALMKGGRQKSRHLFHEQTNSRVSTHVRGLGSMSYIRACIYIVCTKYSSSTSNNMRCCCNTVVTSYHMVVSYCMRLSEEVSSSFTSKYRTRYIYIRTEN